MDFKEERVSNKRQRNEYTYIRIRGGRIGSFLLQECVIQLDFRRNDYDFPSIRRWRNNFFVSKLGRIRFPRRKKKEKKRNIDPGGDLCSFVKNTGTRGRENTTRFFMAYLILRSIFGVKIFSLVAVRVDFSCSFFFFFFIFILRYISREIANNFRRGEQL